MDEILDSAPFHSTSNRKVTLRGLWERLSLFHRLRSTSFNIRPDDIGFIALPYDKFRDFAVSVKLFEAFVLLHFTLNPVVKILVVFDWIYLFKPKLDTRVGDSQLLKMLNYQSAAPAFNSVPA